MNTGKLSINRACGAVAGFLIPLSAVWLGILYLLTDSIGAVISAVFYTGLVLFCVEFLIAVIRRKLVLFSDTFCELLDEMMTGKVEPPQVPEEESLFYKINHRLVQLYEVMRENRECAAREHARLQELISDISHQVKTPITNLKMVNAMLLEQAVPEGERRKFLMDSEIQLDKLDFLIQSMIKTSRLETGVISLEKKMQSMYETLAAALGAVLLSAEKKNICVSVECPEHLEIPHDRKWTEEALFNILDNGVKYTPEGGSIHVFVEKYECYLRTDITDTGKGIPENQQGLIFKRFFRGEDVCHMEGIGIGLYLAREIITRQGGYIKVASELGKGAVFSVFLPVAFL